jgi:hypothetical protein
MNEILTDLIQMVADGFRTPRDVIEHAARLLDGDAAALADFTRRVEATGIPMDLIFPPDLPDLPDG